MKQYKCMIIGIGPAKCEYCKIEDSTNKNYLEDLKLDYTDNEIKKFKLDKEFICTRKRPNNDDINTSLRYNDDQNRPCMFAITEDEELGIESTRQPLIKQLLDQLLYTEKTFMICQNEYVLQLYKNKNKELKHGKKIKKQKNQ